MGRFVGSRHHNQFLPGLKAYNARVSVLEFLVFWEGRKTTKPPNGMFTANKKAQRCPRTLFEFEIVALVYCVFIRFKLLVMSGRLGGITTNLGLRPVIRALLSSMMNPSPAFLQLVVRGQQPLIPLFGVPEKLLLPRVVLVLVVEYVSEPIDAKLLDLFEIDDAAWFLAHFIPSTAHIRFLQKLLPAMVEKLTERQLNTVMKQVEAVKPGSW